jgi:hypothetical protein
MDELCRNVVRKSFELSTGSYERGTDVRVNKETDGS